MTKSRKLKPLTDRVLLEIAVDKMYHKRGFDIDNLRRKFTEFFKTTQIGNRVGLRYKHSDVTVKCIHEPLENGVGYVRIQTSKAPQIDYQFFITSNKDFMQKLIKHELIFNT